MDKIRIDDCICHDRIEEHLEIKDKILLEIDKTNDSNLNLMNSTYSDNISKLDWNVCDDFTRPWVSTFLPIFSEAIKKVIVSMGYNFINLYEMWYQQYLEGDTHGWHIHGKHFTGVYYLEFPKGCSKTEICSPFSLKPKQIDVDEGDFIIFPAHYIHRGLPNKDLRKTIVSFNFDIHASSIDGSPALNTTLIKK